ncbi:LPS translocon maturation chaperone LptM [Arhodomonas sp. SL1]
MPFRTLAVATVALALLLAVTGCGRKGDLYLPEGTPSGAAETPADEA